MQHFLWLTFQALDFMLYLWPITFILLLFIGIACIYNFPFTPSQSRRRYLLVFSPLLLSLLMLIWGTVMAAHQPHRTVPSWPSYVVLSLFLLHIPLSILIVRRMEEIRFFGVSVLSFEIWLGFFCNMMAGMSVSNQWL